MSTARAAFLRSICENPEDDTARLVFADWLDEHGDPERAEFIRLQIGLDAGTLPEERRAEERGRVEWLLARNQPAWWAELPDRPGVTWVTAPFPFIRGFAHGVGFRHGKSWRQHAAEVFDAAPVSYLRCGGVFTGRTTRPVLASPLLGRVADLGGPHLDPEGAVALADNPHLVGRLRELQVSCSAEDEEPVAAALSRATGLRNLESLSFGRIGPTGAAALAGSPNLSRLKNLLLHTSPIGDDGAEALAASPHLSALEHVLLNYTGIGDRGATALARSERLVSLRELYLGGSNPITDAGALAIAASTGLPRLTDLHLWGARIGDVGARALADFAERRGLRVLNLRSCPISAPLREKIDARFNSR